LEKNVEGDKFRFLQFFSSELKSKDNSGFVIEMISFKNDLLDNKLILFINFFIVFLIIFLKYL
jgi:hypothetical protein